MGIVYSAAALLYQRLAKQSAVEKRKHNSSTVNLAGYTRSQIKKRVRESVQFTAREKALLAYVADQDPDDFVLCAKTTQDALSISEYQWVSARRKIEEKGILTQQMVPLSDGSHHWFLDFDFSPLRDAKYDAPTPRESQGKKSESPIYSRAGACAHVIPQKLGDKPVMAHPAAAPRGQAGMCAAGTDNSSRCAAKPVTAQASQPSLPSPKTKPATPAPPGGGGCAPCPPKIHSAKETESMDEKNFFAVKHFFNFFDQHGITRVRLAAQMRRKSDSQRGAPMGFGQPGKPVAEGPPVRTGAAAGLAQQLLARLSHPKIGKRRLELVTAAAEDSQGLSKAILVDDLNADGVRTVKTRWAGPGAVLETSQGNYQAILILAEPMDRVARKSITGQLVELAGGDKGATASGQLHRIPGSVNYKPALAEPFVCRLVEYFTGQGEGVQPVKPAAGSVARTASTFRPGPVRPMQKRQWAASVESMSQGAFRLAVELLDSGVGAAQVEAALGAPEWLRHHNSTDWPRRTREAAERFRAGELYGRRGGARHA